jgi:hypothetical protein
MPEFRVSQLVALRFASDSELPALAKKVLDENLNDRKPRVAQLTSVFVDLLPIRILRVRVHPGVDMLASSDFPPNDRMSKLS